MLIGAALALGLPRNRVFGTITPGARRVLNLVGGVGLLGIFAMFVEHRPVPVPVPLRGRDGAPGPPHRHVIGVTVHPGSQLRVILGWEPLRWVGERSYAIYLWHYPVIVLTTPLNAAPSVLRAVLQTGATLGLAALSWRYVEDPVRHGALGRLWERIRQRQWSAAPAATARPGRWWRWRRSTPWSAPSGSSAWSTPRRPTPAPR